MSQLFKLVYVVIAFLCVQCSSLTLDSDNPVLKTWKGPYQGVPPFDEIKPHHFPRALAQIMDKSLSAYKAVAENPEPANFENTLLPMEKIYERFMRAAILFHIWGSNLSSPEAQEIEVEMAPKMAAFQDQIIQNSELFARIKTIYEKPSKDLKPEQTRLVWHYYTQFVKGGAALDNKQKKRVSEINQKLAQLATQFAQNILTDENSRYLHIKDEKNLKGLPQSLVESAVTEAKSRNLEGWVIANTRSSMDPFLTYSALRPLRKKAFELWITRGDREGKNNNNPLMSQILDLRRERSQIMGYPSYAHWQLSDKMAKEPKQAMALLEQVWKPAKQAVAKDVAAMQAIVDKERGGFQIAPWDYHYYSEKLRQQRYAIDMDMLKPYLQLKNIQKAMFWMAKELYGFDFKKVEGVPVYHPDVFVYEVTHNNKLVGLWYFDAFARKGKRSGAWMNAYREQHRLNSSNTVTLVSNNSNFIKGQKGKPTLLSWDDASTMFHEFGHALHGLSSNVTYPTLSGTNTSTDFVEFPSQIHESWLETPQVLKFLKNQKGESFPEALVNKLKKSTHFNQGFQTVEYLASALVDMEIHLSSQKNIDPRRFEKETLQRLGMPSQVVMRHRLPHFSHVFSTEMYAAGYYSYLWSDVLRRDAFQAFLEGKGPYDKKVARRFKSEILSVGNTVDPAQAFRKFRGRDPKVRALLESKGFKQVQ